MRAKRAVVLFFVLGVFTVFLAGCGKGGEKKKENKHTQTNNPRKEASFTKKTTSAPLSSQKIESLIKALASESVEESYNAAVALAKTGDKSLVPRLIAGLSSPNWRMRTGCAKALGKFKDERAIDPLIKALKDRKSAVRWASAIALGELKAKKAVDPLIESLKKDVFWGVRTGAAWALGEIGDKKAVEPLILALKNESYDVRLASYKALKKLTGKDFGKHYQAWWRWWQENKS